MPTEIKGVIGLRRALKNFEPDLAKETTKQLGAFLRPVVVTARGYMPSDSNVPSGWLKREGAEGRWANRFYNQSAAKKGIKYKTTPSKANRSGFTSLASILNTNIGGAIYETAGRKAGITGNFTPKLGGTIVGPKQKMQGRAMFAAYAQDQGKAKAHIIKALETAGRKFNERQSNG
jgi:hypothetical protein